MSAMEPAVEDGAHDSVELEALFDSIAANAATDVAASCGNDDVVAQVGQLTRRLHDALSQLGYDRLIADAAQAIPDTRDRLAYVADMTEKAAMTSLAAIEAAKPIQQSLSTEAKELSRQWDRLFLQELSVEDFRELASRTRVFLHAIPDKTDATNAQLTDIMMAQDFQDLTGQVIKKVTEVAQDVESQLLKLLIDHAPMEKRVAVQSAGLLNGPLINAEGRSDVVTSQGQVDELLESLGF